MTIKIPDSGYLVGLHGGDYLYAFRRERGALGDADALKKAREAARNLAADTRQSVDIVAVGARGQDRYIVDEIQPSRSLKEPGVNPRTGVRTAGKTQPYQRGAKSHSTKKIPAIAYRDTTVKTWFERDRAHVDLQNSKTGQTLIEFWDEDVGQLMEDGFLDRRNLHRSLYDYAVYLGAIKGK